MATLSRAYKFRSLEQAEKYYNSFCLSSNYMIYDGNGDKIGDYWLIGTYCKSITDIIEYI